MKIIKRIEINNFRSIRKLDLNIDSSVSILSGVNSCGKTNVLRALNLFFNEEVGFGKRLSVSDFFTKNGSHSTRISIKITFKSYESELIKRQRKIPDNFSVEKKYTYNAGFINQSLKYYNVSEKQEEYVKHFLSKWIRFHYMPTDRKIFFQKIYNELSEFLGSPYGFKKLKSQLSDLRTNFDTIEESLNARDIAQLELSEDLKSKLGISKVGYALPEVRNLLKVLDFSVERVNGERNFVSTEGDGVKFINLLQILDIFDSRYSKESRTRPYASIWAIDEPENSLEQRNIELFKQEVFEKHSQNKQVFFTSHSPEFLLEKDQKERNKFYGFDKINGETKLINEEKVDIQRLPFTEFERQMFIEKMGIGLTRTEKLNLLASIEEQKKLNSSLHQEIRSATKPMLIVEDEYIELYKVAYLKINNVNFLENDLSVVFDNTCDFKIISARGADQLAGFLKMSNTELTNTSGIVGLFDFDSKGVDLFKRLKKHNDWSKDVDGDKGSGYTRRRNGHLCFYAMLLPIPNRLDQVADIKYKTNHVEVENLLPEEILINHKLAKEEKIFGDAKALIFKDNKKSDLWKKAISFEKKDFSDFEPLFNKVSTLLKISKI